MAKATKIWRATEENDGNNNKNELNVEFVSFSVWFLVFGLELLYLGTVDDVFDMGMSWMARKIALFLTKCVYVLSCHTAKMDLIFVYFVAHVLANCVEIANFLGRYLS